MLLANVRVMNVVRESDGARVSTRVEVSTSLQDIFVQGGRITFMNTNGTWRLTKSAPVPSTAFDGGGRVVMAGLGESSGVGSRTGD